MEWECPECGSLNLTERICPNCGHDREAQEAKPKRATKAKEGTEDA
jgi:rubrerythrin